MPYLRQAEKIKTGTVGGGVGEDHREIFALGHAELEVDHVAHRVLLEQTGKDDAARHCDAQHGEHGFQHLALDVADDHERGLRQPALEAQFFHPCLAIAGRRLGTHRLRRTQGGSSPYRKHGPGLRLPRGWPPQLPSRSWGGRANCK